MYIFFKLWFCYLEPCLSKCGHLEVIYLLLWNANSETTRSAESGHLNSANCVLIFEASSGSPWIFTYLVLTFHFPLVVTSFSLCCLTSVSQYPHRVVSRQKPISSSVSRSKLVEMLSKIPLGSHVLQLSGSHAVQNQTGLVLGLVWLSLKKKKSSGGFIPNWLFLNIVSQNTELSLQMLLLNHIFPSGMRAVSFLDLSVSLSLLKFISLDPSLSRSVWVLFLSFFVETFLSSALAADVLAQGINNDMSIFARGHPHSLWGLKTWHPLQSLWS